MGERVLLGLRVDAAARLRNRRRILVLAYHNVIPRGEPTAGDPSLHLRQRPFAEQLDLLVETHEIVPLSWLLSTSGSGQVDLSRPRAAITFDDAYRGALTAGMEELRSRGLPATVFVAPGMLGREGFWWDRLAVAMAGSTGTGLREHALTSLGGRQDDVLRWARSKQLPEDRSLPKHARPADLELLRSIAGTPGITVASHGWRHVSLPDVGPREVSRELSEPLDWFRTHGIPAEPWLAYPYGRHSPAVRSQARNAYSLAVTTLRGYAVSRAPNLPEPMDVPRTNVPAGASLDRFRLLTSGALDLL